MDGEFLNKVLEFYREGSWRKILNLNETSDDKDALKLLWVWPSEKNLEFLKKTIEEVNCHGITSIGCGCGLLEWIINRSTGIPIIGYEINQEWWESKYSNPSFIKLQYWKQEQPTLEPDYALLFCYFNDGVAFSDYLKLYKGSMVIIIGPGKYKGHHTNPEPFKAKFGSMDWQLYNYQEVKNSKDFIAVYVKRK